MMSGLVEVNHVQLEEVSLYRNFVLVINDHAPRSFLVKEVLKLERAFAVKMNDWLG